ncbi:FimV/HubP family polar landmark protein [Marinimicrobium locisalis]|uniref:FimV/HubP family polar landmark protein n=1 Tax=Marinimicrobium locisalis TaxID=546022 RepID=UPI003221695C
MHLLRKLVFVIGLATLMAAQQGYALGLGESELHSALNQPLRADIQLTNLRGLDKDEIIVRLASLDDFERAGLDRLPFYSQLQFELMLDHPDGPMVRVTTNDPVKEPYLNFLVEARWASGRLLREYTFLLDLPTFDDERQAQPVQTAPSQAERPRANRQQQRRQDTSQPRREEPSSQSREPAYAGETYEVGSSDTLWEIALRVRPSRELSVHQTMLAIQRKNPEAFINGNINLLREGQVLRLPDRSEIQGMDQQRAVREVADHNREWSEKRTMGAQLDAGQRGRSERSGPSEASGQVRLAAPGGSGEAGQGGGESTDSGAELESELAAAEEELDKTRRENRELSNRVEELESQIETMESLIEASNEQLSALQAAAANRSEAAGEGEDAREQGAQPQSAESARAESSAVSSAAESEAAAVAQAQASEAPEQAEPEPVATPAEEERDRKTRVVRSLPEEKTIIDHLVDNLLWIAAGLLVILLAVYAFMRRRASQAEQSGEAYEEDFEPAYEEEGFVAESDSNDYAEEEDGIDLSREEEVEPGAEAWDEDADSGVEAETGDVVGEADIYIAYGKLDQAEELLLKGLEKEPSSPAILSKLLEVYAEKQDVPAFDRYYTVLLGTDDRMAIQRAGELRDTIPGAGEFDISALEESGASEPAPASTDTEPSYDLTDEQDDLDFSFDLDESKDTTEGGDDLSLDDDFSFDLDDELGSEEDAAAVTSEGGIESSTSRYDLSFEESPEVNPEDEFALDFDLEEEDSAVSLEEQAPASEATDKQSGESEEESFPELDLNLDEEELTSERDEQAVSAEDDWSFDLEADESTGANLEALDDELSLLDEEGSEDKTEVHLEPADDLSAGAPDDWEDDLTVHEAGLDQDATSEDDQEAGQDAFADLDEALAEATEEPSSEKPSEPEAAREEPGDEADLDLDDVDMGDMDLSAFDEEMSGLDADLGGDEEPAAPAQEEELSLGSEEPEESVSADVDEDTMFEEALSGLETEETPDAEEASAESGSEQGSGEDMDAELDFLADTDEAATKLDLARAYIDMGDADGARDILEEVRQEGNDQQQQEAAELLGRIES